MLVVLDLADDAVHDLDRFERMLARRRFGARASPRRRRRRPRSPRRRPRRASAPATMIIDSSICVATITGLPARRQARRIRRCTVGTCSGRISTPRSPRATMIPSSLVDDRVEPVDRHRLLELGHDRGAIADQRRAPRRCLPGRWTNESATQSAPRSRPNSRSRRSFGGERRQRNDRVGHVDALAIGELAADDDARHRMTLAAALDFEPELAVVEQQLQARAPSRRRLPDAEGSRAFAAAAPDRRRAAATRLASASPGRARTFRCASLGPCRSISNADRSIAFSSTARIASIRFRWSAASAVAEVQPKDIDAGVKQRIDERAGVELVGPSVATILALR